MPAFSPKIIQLVPVVQQHEGGIITNFLLALTVDGGLFMIHLPWEAAGYNAFVDTPTAQITEVPLDSTHWTPR